MTHMLRNHAGCNQQPIRTIQVHVMTLEEKLKEVSIVQLCNSSRQPLCNKQGHCLITAGTVCSVQVVETVSQFPLLGPVAHQVQQLLYGLTFVVWQSDRRSVDETLHSSSYFFSHLPTLEKTQILRSHQTVAVSGHHFSIFILKRI